MRVTGRFKRYFIRGMAILLPTVLTIWILVTAYSFVQTHFTIYLNRGLVWVIWKVLGDRAPTIEDLNEIFIEGWAGSAVGFFIAVLIICLVGALIASVLGRALWRVVETFIMNTPILNKIYPYVKQVTDFVLTRQEEHQKLFSRVVAVEYPRPGIWSLGMVTGEGLGRISEKTGEEMLTVLIPNSPTPVTGYVIMVPRDLTIPLDISIEAAFRFTLSAGVINPANQAALPGNGQVPPESSVL